MVNGYIYRITNKINGKVYIGSSIVKGRIKQHLNLNKGGLQQMKYLQNLPKLELVVEIGETQQKDMLIVMKKN